MDLDILQQTAQHRDDRVAESVLLERPDTGDDFVAPRTDIEKALAGFWSELLGIDKVGVTDSFFDLGGHSLVAVRLFRMIKKAYAVDFPISVLFEAPTIEKCSQLIEASGVTKVDTDTKKDGEQSGASEKVHFSHLVPMNVGRDAHATPLFICAGMFGNILNLRHLAMHIGQDRPVYGLQARGLYGGQAPHETFEEMAASYLEEVRTIQPQGPYLLAGFSGGGLVAYEMAQILKRNGESVDLLIMLDTPYPESADLSTIDKLTMKLQDLRRDKGAFLAQWARRRLAWELDRIRKSRERAEYSSEQFHNRDIEAAFRRALWSYNVQPYQGPVLLLRPKLQFAYRLLDGRLLHSDRNIVRPDNGWSPYLQHFIVKEVPGDHDSMVLEPHVRLLA
jgi:thioesterase domain-containing protein/acyl carrier protein